jgi:hypothetical protein
MRREGGGGRGRKGEREGQQRRKIVRCEKPRCERKGDEQMNRVNITSFIGT